MVSKLTTGISKENGIIEDAAKSLLGLHMSAIRDLAFKITEGSMRSVVKELVAEVIQLDPNSLIDRLGERLNSVLKDIGLKIINLDIQQIEVLLPEASFFVGDIPGVSTIPLPTSG
jgi:flotillin